MCDFQKSELISKYSTPLRFISCMAAFRMSGRSYSRQKEAAAGIHCPRSVSTEAFIIVGHWGLTEITSTRSMVSARLKRTSNHMPGRSASHDRQGVARDPSTASAASQGKGAAVARHCGDGDILAFRSHGWISLMLHTVFRSAVFAVCVSRSSRTADSGNEAVQMRPRPGKVPASQIIQDIFSVSADSQDLMTTLVVYDWAIGSLMTSTIFRSGTYFSTSVASSYSAFRLRYSSSDTPRSANCQGI